MKISLLALAAAATVAAGVLGTGRALASTHQASTKTVRIVMHDPGCHWFMEHGKYRKTDTVKANRVRLVDRDEGALLVASRYGMKHIPVGESLIVAAGTT